jgi:hypothetical protein
MVNRDEMIAYLLDEMSEAERAAFVDRWFTDADLYEQVRMVEAGLLDEYVRGGLSDKQRRQVEQSLLGSEVQRDKLRFAQSVRAALPRPKRIRFPWASVAAAALLASAGLSAWLGLENRRLQNDVARLQTSVKSFNSGGVFTLDLPSDTVRGESTPRIAKLTPDVGVLRLELELRPGDESQTFSASVSSGGRTVWTEGPLRAEHENGAVVARVWIPAAVVGPGEYFLGLASSGQPVAYYRFVLR